MKNLKLISSLAIFIFFGSCGNKTVPDIKNDSANDKLRGEGFYNQPGVINCIDEKGKRQGLWIITGAMKKDSRFVDTARVEEGHYVDNVKTGLWEEFDPNGSVKIQINYSGNKIDTFFAPGHGKYMRTLGDTSVGAMNLIDPNGKRQGYWEITGAMANDGNYRKDGIVEAGTYIDNAKTGLWTEYNPDGKVKRTAIYKDDQEVK
jgi:antitoxin component YwqK of YwqJK toxin-antitoxin module